MRLRIEPFLYAIIAAIAALFLGYTLGKDAMEQAIYMTRGTARVGLPLVLMIYTAPAFYKLWQNQWTRWLMQNRRSLGLSFALSHTVHLLAIFNYLRLPGSVPAAPHEIAGYVLIYAMAFSSNSYSIKALGTWWKRLHAVGIQLIFVTYLIGYASSLAEPERRPLGVVVVPLLVAALGIRLAAWLKGRSAKAEATANPGALN